MTHLQALIIPMQFLLQVASDVRRISSYSDKRKQLLKMTFLVNEQNVSVMYIDINAISLCLDLNIFQQDECFCSNLGLKVYRILETPSLSQIWVICHLLPFLRVGQNTVSVLELKTLQFRNTKRNCSPYLLVSSLFEDAVRRKL